jgi:hypothetical protein
MKGWVLYDDMGQVSTFVCFQTRALAMADAWPGERAVRAVVFFQPVPRAEPKRKPKRRRPAGGSR